jgi:hypothetical protein
MQNLKIKKNTKKSSKIKKTKKKSLNPFSLQPLADAYQNFKKKQKKEIAEKIKREKIEQKKQLLQEKNQKIREEEQKIKDEVKRIKDLEIKKQQEENQKNNKLNAKSNKKTQPPSSKTQNTPRKLSYNQQQQLNSLPKKIENLENEISMAQKLFSDPTFYQNPDAHSLSIKLREMEHQLEALYDQWSKLDNGS